jgi:prepilin-type N-terminal cleavage/methylation domain-containing protein
MLMYHFSTHKFGMRALDDRGFTLIEVLVSMIMAVIITGALFAILEVSVQQTTRTTDFIQADQLGRDTMTKIVDELHSVCIAPGFTPIQENSTENKLIFYNAYSKESVISKTEAYKHEIEWSGETTKKLTDTATPASGGEWPNFEYKSTPTTTLLAEHVTRGATGTTKIPIFKYYKYAKEAEGSTESPEGTLSELAAPLTKTTAGEAAAVLITFKTAPIDGSSALDRSAELSNQVTLAFSAPGSESTISDSPCH